MGDVKRLHNSLVLDADFVSELWATLRDKEGSLSPEKLSELIALKMYDQFCCHSLEGVTELTQEERGGTDNDNGQTAAILGQDASRQKHDRA